MKMEYKHWFHSIIWLVIGREDLSWRFTFVFNRQQAITHPRQSFKYFLMDQDSICWESKLTVKHLGRSSDLISADSLINMISYKQQCWWVSVSTFSSKITMHKSYSYNATYAYGTFEHAPQSKQNLAWFLQSDVSQWRFQNQRQAMKSRQNYI